MPATRPKDIGTRAETAVLKQLLPYFPEARREVLHGNKDWGDILADGSFVFEVKGGHQAWTSAPGDIDRWLIEAEVEAANAGRPFGILVVQRKGYAAERAGKWWAWVPIAIFAHLVGGEALIANGAPLRLELHDLLEVLADQGFGGSD